MTPKKNTPRVIKVRVLIKSGIRSPEILSEIKSADSISKKEPPKGRVRNLVRVLPVAVPKFKAVDFSSHRR